jgi:HlyD family secretion protein
MKSSIHVFHLFPVILIFAIISILVSGCASSQSPPAGNQVATVKRGNLNTEITGAGNLAFTQTSDLAFEMAGYVEDVLVTEGLSVKAGQELARLDTSEWNKAVSALNKTLTTAQRNLISRQRDLTTAQRQINSRQLAVTQAQLDLQNSQYNLNQISEVKSAQDAVDRAELDLKIAQANIQVARIQGREADYLPEDVAYFGDRLELAKQKLQNILNLKDVNISTTVSMQIKQAEIKVEQSKNSLANALDAVEDANTAVTDAQLNLKDAEQAVKDSQNDLDEASNLSPIVKAPFDGFITKVNVVGGDEVQKGTVAMQIADPAKFKADIIVGEKDIVKIQENSTATVQIDAIQGITLPAAVKHISPTAAIQQGVVSYSVTVEIQSLQSLRTSTLIPQPPTSIPQPSPSIPDQTATAPRSQRQFPQSGMGQIPQSQLNRQAVQSPTSQLSEIRAGMSVTVSIIIAESNNVLLVPNQAIIYKGGTSQVQVLKDGVDETRTVQTGKNNWQYTEVTEGLTEGEQVEIPSAASAIAPQTQTQSQQRQQQIIIPNTGGGGNRSR